MINRDIAMRNSHADNERSASRDDWQAELMGCDWLQ
jgi:hypothetical protein